MTLPFNFIAIMSFLSFQTDEFNESNESSSINASMNGRKVNSSPYHSFNSMNFCSELSVDWLRVRSYHYLELLVTSPRARGRGVATGIVRELQSKD